MTSCNHVLFSDGLNHTEPELKARLMLLENSEALNKLPAILFIGVLLLIGFCGNLLVCAVYYSKFTASTSKYFILSLAIFDLVNCLIAIPAEMVDLRFDYHFNSPHVCRIMRFTITFNTTASAGALLAIAIDRYRKICRPFERQMSLKETRLWIVFAVVGSLLLSWPATLLYGRRTEQMSGIDTYDCSFDDSVVDKWYPQVYIVILTVMCLATMAALVVLYVLIVIRVWRQKSRRKKMSRSAITKNSSASLADSIRKLNCMVGNTTEVMQLSADRDASILSTEQRRRQNLNQNQTIKTTIMLFCVTMVFIISFIPFFALQIIKSIYPGFEDGLHCNHSALIAYKLFLRSFFINSAANPIIYSFCNDGFRLECKTVVRKVFCCLCKQSSCCQSPKPCEEINVPNQFRSLEAVPDC